MQNTELIHSRRILFRKFIDQDKKEDIDIFSHKNLKYFAEENLEDKNSFIDQIIKSYKEKENFHFWHLVKIGENKSLGMAKIDIEKNLARVKILISEKVKNRGYGTEALEILIQEVFTQGLATRVEVKSQKENGPWIEVIKKNHLEKYKEDDKFIYYQMTNIDYMKYFAIFGEIDL